ncbi:MAG TPA: rhomboid family intramembrane serine protease [Terriglobia bacterium]|nr:rhomboid family intramembrane serine protease [Terriglobia bacterium]
MEFESPQPTPVSPWPPPEPPARVQNTGPRHFPIATLTIIALCVAVFVLQTLAGGSKNTGVLLDFGASYRPYFQHGQYWRAVLPLFLHIGLWHLAVNMFTLLMIGPVLERMYGYGRFALIYLGAGIAGCVVSMYHGHVIAAGASGAIFGVAGAIVVAGWAHRDALPHELARIFRRGVFTLVLLAFIVVQLAAGHLVSNIDNWGHLGGLLGGALLAFLIPLPRRVEIFHHGAGWEPAQSDLGAARWSTAPQPFQMIVLVPVAIVAISMIAAARHYHGASQVTRLLAEGQRLEAAHQPGHAFDLYRRAQKLDARDERPSIALGQLDLRQHKPAQAINEFQQALRIDPLSVMARFGLAAAYQVNGNTAEAEKQFEALAAQNPGAPDVQEAVADLLSEQKLYARAIERYQVVLRLSPNEPLAHNNLAWLYATADDPRYRDPAAALDHARKAVALSGWREPNFIDTLAEALYVNHRYADAVKAETRALALAPDNREFQQHMERYRRAAEGQDGAAPTTGTAL